jgi:hypothetical protein
MPDYKNIVRNKPKKLPKGVQTISEAATRRGRGGSVLVQERISKKGETSEFTRRGKRAFAAAESRVGGGIKAIDRELAQRQRVKADLGKRAKLRGRVKLPGILGAAGMPGQVQEYKAQGGLSTSDIFKKMQGKKVIKKYVPKGRET